MKRLSLLLLLPLASGALFAQTGYTITGTVPANGTVGVSYSSGSLTVSPGSPIAAWSISAGSLPLGLTLNPTTGTSTTAAISGTPTTAGSYTFTVQANIGTNPNAAPILVKQPYAVTIVLPGVSLPSGSLPDGEVSVSYFQNLTALGGYGPGTYTFAQTGGTLPQGLQLTGGAISGIPTTAGPSSFTVQVTSHSNLYPSVTASGTFSINIVPAPLITTSSLPAGTVGSSYTATLAATGGTPPYTWQLTGNSLPGGLTLASSGNISGTPTTAGSFSFQVTVSDSQQGSASGSFTIRIAPVALAITTSSLSAGTVGVSYSATAAATGGTPPYTWSVASGALPAGVSIGSAGVISGTPTAAGTFSVTLKVTDSAQATATKAYSVTVAATTPLSITTPTPLPGGLVGVFYMQGISATGGVPPNGYSYLWSVSAGTVPPGLAFRVLPASGGNFNSTAGSADYGARLKAVLNDALTGVRSFVSTTNVENLLMGTPTAAGTFNFTLQVADSVGQTATKAFTITVASAVKIITAPVMPDGTTGVLYSQQFLASGGLTPFVWSVASGSIPSGLSLNTANGLVSGTPDTPGTYTFTLAVADQSGGKDSAAYTIRIVAPLSITTQYPIPGGAEPIVGAPFTLVFAAAGGSLPYQWFVSTGSLPTGLMLSAAGSLTGSPTATGTFTFTIQVVDAAGRNTTKAFTIVVVQLTITTASPLPPATVGTPYNQTLALDGVGVTYLATFTWSISAGAAPAGLSLNPSTTPPTTGSLSGTPTAPGTFTFTVSVTGAGQTATKSFTITVVPPPGPPVIITVSPATPAPATQPALGVSIGKAYPLDITGQVTLTFAPDSPSPDDPSVVFVATNSRTVSFTVPANTTQAVFSGTAPGVQTGTVSGTITLTLTLKLTASGIDITPSPAPSTKLTIAKSAPVIIPQGVTVTPTSGGFNIVVVGYATSREMVSAAVTFTAASGVTLASSQATIPLATVFTSWYTNSASAAYGSNFSLTMPFTIANGTSTNSLTSVSVQLTNAQGSSTSMSAAAH